jgi:uncharacterized membrane protein
MMDFKTTRQFKNKNMNLKRIFGALLTLLGIVGLVYTAVTFVNTKGNNQDVKILFMYGILGTIFFVSGISLIKTTKDES